MASNIGLNFDSDSFKTFNKTLTSFNRISKNIDKKMLAIASSVEILRNSMFSINPIFNTFIGNVINLKTALSMIKGLKGINSVSKPIADLEKKFSSLFSSLSKFDISKQKLSKALESIELLVDLMKSVNLNVTTNKFTLSKDILQIAKAFEIIDKINLNVIDIEKFVLGIKKLTIAFTGDRISPFKAVKNFMSGASTGDFRKMSNALGFFEGGIAEKLNNISSINFGDFSNLSSAIKRLSSVFETLGKLKLDNIDFVKIKKTFSSLMEMFTGVGGGIFNRLGKSFKEIQGSGIKEAAKDFSGSQGGIFGRVFNSFTKINFGKVSKSFSILRGKDGLINQLAQISKISSKLKDFSSFSKSITSLSKSFNELGKLNFSNVDIGKISKAITGIMGIFTRRRGIMGFGRGLIGFRKSFINEIAKFSGMKLDGLANFGRAIQSFSKSVTKIKPGKASVEGARSFGRFVSELIKNMRDSIKSLSKLNLKSLTKFNTFATALSKLGKFSSKGFKKGFDGNDTGEDMGKGVINGFKRKLKIRSPSLVFLSFGKMAARGFEIGFRAVLKTITFIPKGIVRSFMKPFSMIKNRLMFTMRDIGFAIQGFFRGMIGNTIEFESAFTGVLKTLDTSSIFESGGQGAVDTFVSGLKDGLHELATAGDSMSAGLENGFVSLSKIAELAGQFGVANENILGFTEVVSQLTIASDFTGESGAEFLAKFTAITGTENFEQISSSVVALGNNLAVTEAEIGTVAQRIVAAGSSMGLSEQEILGWSAAMKASGLAAEAGSTAFTQFSTQIVKAVASDDADVIENWANVIGKTNEEFVELFRNDPSGAMQELIGSMGELDREGLVKLENQLGLTGIRLDLFVGSLSKAENNSQVLSRALNISKEAFMEMGGTAEEYNALQEEAARRMETTEFKLNRMKNVMKSLSNTIGKFLQPAFNKILDTISNIVTKVDVFFKDVQKFGSLGGILGFDVESLSEGREVIEETIGMVSDAVVDGPSFIEHQFKPGDTLDSVARQYGTTYQELLEMLGKDAEDFMSATSIPIPIELLGGEHGAELDDYMREQQAKLADAAANVDETTAIKLPFFFGDLTIPSEEAVKIQNLRNDWNNVKESIDGIKEGLLTIVGGDIKSGIEDISESFDNMKSSMSNMILGISSLRGANTAGDGAEEQFDEMGFTTTTAGSGTLIMRILEDMFGVDLEPAYNFIKENMASLIEIGLKTLIGGPIGMAFSISQFLIEYLGINFGDLKQSWDSNTSIQEKFNLVGNLIIDSIRTGLQNAFDSASNLFDGLFGGGKNAEEMFDEMGFVPEDNGSSIISKIIRGVFGISMSGEIAGAALADGVHLIARSLLDLITFGIEHADTIFATTGGVLLAIENFFIGLISSFLTEMVSEENVDSLKEGVVNMLTMALDKIASGEFSDSIRQVFSEAFGFESYDELGEVIADKLTQWGVSFVANLFTFWNVLDYGLQNVLLTMGNVANTISPGDPVDTQKIEEYMEFLKIQSDLFGLMTTREPIEFSALFNAGLIYDDKTFIGISRISEEFDVNAEMLVAELDVFVNNISNKLSEGDISISEAYSEMLNAGFDTDVIENILEDRGFELDIKDILATEGFQTASEEDRQNAKDAISQWFGSVTDISDEELQDLIENSLITFGDVGMDVGMAQALLEGMTSEQAAELPEETREKLKESMGVTFTEAGIMLGDELINGFGESFVEGSDAYDSYMESIGTFGTDIESAFKTAVESNSPSKMTMRIGNDLITGLALGMMDTVNLIDKPIMMLENKINNMSYFVKEAANNFNLLHAAIIQAFDIDYTIKARIGGLSNEMVNGRGGHVLNREFGGYVNSGSVVEILENNLPFELFRTAKQTFMLANESGTVLSPRGSGELSSGNFLNRGSSVSNSNSTIINVPVTFNTVPSDVTDSQLSEISTRISTAVHDRINDGIQSNTLTDKLTQRGKV